MAEKVVKTLCSLCAVSACGMEVTVRDDRVVGSVGIRSTPKAKEPCVPKLGGQRTPLLSRPPKVSSEMGWAAGGREPPGTKP